MVKVDQVKKTQKLMPGALDVLARSGVQRLIYMTDATDISRTVSDIRRLPRGSIVIFRAYDSENREDLARKLFLIVKSVNLLFLVAGDVRLARRLGADGVHMPEYMLYASRQNLTGFLLVTAACHSRRALNRAAMMDVDLALVSPVFKTPSHPEATPLGIHRFARLMQKTPLPIAALGGVNINTAGHLRDLDVQAVAGMSAIV